MKVFVHFCRYRYANSKSPTHRKKDNNINVEIQTSFKSRISLKILFIHVFASKCAKINIKQEDPVQGIPR